MKNMENKFLKEMEWTELWNITSENNITGEFNLNSK